MQVNDIYKVQINPGEDKCKVKLTGFSANYEFCRFDILDGEHKGKALCRGYFEVDGWIKEE